MDGSAGPASGDGRQPGCHLSDGDIALPPCCPVDVALLGDPASGLTSEIRTSLAGFAHVLRLSETTVRDWLAGGPPADLLVVAQSWPDEYMRVEVNDLVARAGISRVLCVYGPWCGSDGRTRTLWPLAARVPVDQLRLRIRHEVSALAGWTPVLPLTAGRDEAFSHRTPHPAELSLAVSVSSPDRVYHQTLSYALAALGARIVAPTDPACDVRLVDIDPDGFGCERHSSGDSPTVESPVPVVALRGFPDWPATSRPASIAVVVPKLAPLAQVVSQLQEAAVTGRPSSHTAS